MTDGLTFMEYTYSFIELDGNIDSTVNCMLNLWPDAAFYSNRVGSGGETARLALPKNTKHLFQFWYILNKPDITCLFVSFRGVAGWWMFNL